MKWGGERERGGRREEKEEKEGGDLSGGRERRLEGPSSPSFCVEVDVRWWWGLTSPLVGLQDLKRNDVLGLACLVWWWWELVLIESLNWKCYHK